MRTTPVLAIPLLCVPIWVPCGAPLWGQGKDDAPTTEQFEPEMDTTCGMWTKTRLEWGDSIELKHPDAARPALVLENTVAELKSTGDAIHGDVDNAAELQNSLLVEYDYTPDDDSGCVGLAAVTVSCKVGATAMLAGSESTAVSVAALHPDVKLRCNGKTAGVYAGEPLVAQAEANSGESLELLLQGQYKGFGIESPLVVESGTTSEATASLADVLVVPTRKADNVKVTVQGLLLGFVKRDGGSASVAGNGRTTFESFTLCDTVGDCPKLPDPWRQGG